MAILSNKTVTVYGREMFFNGAYHQITNISGNKNRLSFDVAAYESKDKEVVIDVIQYDFVPDVSDTSANFIKQGYEYLKTLSEFNNAVDVSEDDE